MFGFHLKINSYYFLLFLAASLLLYWLCPKKYRYIPLLVESVVFLLLVDWKSIFFILFSMIVIFLCAYFIDKNAKKQKDYISLHKGEMTLEEKKAYKTKNKHIRKSLLVVGILAVTILLGIMKYLGFLLGSVQSIVQLFGGNFAFELRGWFLPVGISFYTFQAIGYLVDVYWGKYEAERNPFRFALFMFYFPKLLQGPIVRYNEMKETLFEEKTLTYDNFTNGLKRMAFGYLKKMVVADALMAFLKFAFANVAELSGVESFLSVVLYFIQDYCDFSGYMDIAIGASMTFGIVLPENFNRPYFARNIDEYWRRWHITLGTWFKDYIFYPLSISRFSLGIGKFFKKFSKGLGQKMPAVFGLIVVWLLTGLWHGASWNYVLWGGYYGVIIIISIFLEPLKNWFYEKTKISRNNVFIQIWQHLLTLFLLAFGKILFMCNDLSSTWQMFVQCFHWNNLSLQNIWNQIGDSSFFTAISCFAPIFIVDLIQEIWPKTSFLSKFNRLPIYVRWPIMIALIVVIVWFGWYGNGLPHFDFGYTQF